MPRLGVKVHASSVRVAYGPSWARLFCRLLTSLLLVATATIHVVASEGASTLSESEAVRDWLKASEVGYGPGRSRAVEAFGRVCCHGDEGVFLEAIGLAQEQGITFLLRDAIAHELRTDNKGTLAVLASALRHSDPAVRRTVADVLFIGPAAKELVPALANALEDEDAGVRQRVARAIGKIGPPADGAIPALVAELVKDRGPLTIPMEARKDAANALGMIGEAAVPALTALLESDSSFVRWQALVGLSSARPDDGVPLLWNLLKGQEPRNPMSSCSHKEPAKLLASVGAGVASDLAESFWELEGPVSSRKVAQSSKLIREIVRMLAWVVQRDPHAEARYAAAEGIGAIGTEFREDIIMWEEKYHEPLLEVLDLVGEAAVPALVAGLSDEAPHVRRRSIDALGELGPAAASGASALEQLLTHKEAARRSSYDVRVAASLYLIGGDSAPAGVRTLIVALSDGDENVRSWAFNSLTTKDALWSEAAVPTLVAGLKDENPNVRRAVAIALGNLGPAAKAVVPFLREEPQSLVAIDLLNASVFDIGAFESGFPAASETSAPMGVGFDSKKKKNRGHETTRPPEKSTSSVRVPAGIYIEFPSSGTSVSPGQTITVTVGLLGGFEPARMLVYAAKEAQFLDSANEEGLWQVQLTVPSDGWVYASAFDAAETWAEATPINLFVTSTATLDGLSVPSKTHVFPPSMTVQVSVVGSFSDGVSRDLSEDPGTSYEVANETVASIDTAGAVTGHSLGQTLVTVTHGGLSATGVIEVVNVPLRLQLGDDQLTWAPVAGAATYDIVKGDLDTLMSSDGDFEAATDECVASGVGENTLQVLDPNPNQDIWFLVRAVGLGGGSQTYDTSIDWPFASQVGSRDDEINAAWNSCP